VIGIESRIDALQEVEVRTLSGAVKVTGELTGYDELNGSVTIETESGAYVKAHVRETFLL
jgi:hypothetical protein